MTTRQRSGHDLTAILADLAVAPYPAYVDDILATTAQRRQRPGWTFPDRWLPVDRTTRPVGAPYASLRFLGTIALMVLLLAAAIAAYVGIQRRLPQPFGPAANGAIAVVRDGDIYLADPTTGKVRLLVGGPGIDTRPAFSPDGTRLLFLRSDEVPIRAPDGGGISGRLFMAELASGTVTELTGQLDDLASTAISPDGRTIALISRVDGRTRISLASTDGSGVRVLDTIDSGGGNLAYLPPDGHELAFMTASDLQGRRRGIAAVDLSTGSIRPIVPGSTTSDLYGSFSTSSRGEIAYARFWRANDGEIQIEMRVVGIDGADDRTIARTAGAMAYPLWSPSGRYLLVQRDDPIARVSRPVILEVDGGGEVVVRTEISHVDAGREWSPDESTILATRTDEQGIDQQQESWDVSTGIVTPVAWPSTTVPAWQRLAP